MMRRGGRRRKIVRRAAGRAVWAGVLALAAGPAAAAEAPVFEADGVRAVAHADCDATAWAAITLPGERDSTRFAARTSFAARIEPHTAAIVAAAAAWLDGEGACAGADPPASLTLVGIVDALPVWGARATRADGWRLDDAPADARAVGFLAPALPVSFDCARFAAEVEPRVGELATKMFTIKAAHTTGQWSHTKALERLAPMHAEAMDLAAAWGLAWDCPGSGAVAELAIRIDLERETLFEEGEGDVRDRLAALGSAADVAALRTALLGDPARPMVAAFAETVDAAGEGPRFRYGGFRRPAAGRIEAAFAERGGGRSR